MMNEKVMRGVALIAVALFFGVQSLTYTVGTLAHAGPGLFPLMISAVVGLIGLVLLVESYFEEPEPLHYNVRNLGLIVLSLVGFVLIAQHLNMLLAVVYLVFVSSLAGNDFSLKRSIKISAVLIGIAYAFKVFLGLNLPLPGVA